MPKRIADTVQRLHLEDEALSAVARRTNRPQSDFVIEAIEPTHHLVHVVPYFRSEEEWAYLYNPADHSTCALSTTFSSDYAWTEILGC